MEIYGDVAFWMDVKHHIDVKQVHGDAFSGRIAIGQAGINYELHHQQEWPLWVLCARYALV